MKLLHKAIPSEFLANLPEGMKFIQRNGRGFLVVEQLFCPNGHSLMSESVHIHGEPSIGIEVERANGPGRIYLDAFWGSHAKLYDFLPAHPEEIETARATCTECGVSLIEPGTCGDPNCKAQHRIILSLPQKGNRISACARLGCPDHTLVASDLPTSVRQQISEINYFGHGEDEQFDGI